MKTITMVHKIRLQPTPAQVKCLFRAAAAARHAYNWGLDTLNLEYEINRELYRLGIMTSSKYSDPVNVLKKQYNQVKPEWVMVNNGTATQEAFSDLKKSLSRFWDITKGKIKMPASKPRKDGKPTGWPRFRNKRENNSFTCTYASLRVDGNFITYNSREVGPIKMCESPRWDGDIKNGIFSFDGFYWHISLQIQREVEIPINNKPAVGVDLGIKYLAVTSDNVVYDNPRPLKENLDKLAKLQRQYSRSLRLTNPDCYDENGKPIKGRYPIKSNRALALELKIKKLHLHIKNIRDNAAHQMTSEIVKTHGDVVLEDLNIRGMLKNDKLAKHIADASLYEKRRQFEYKTALTGAEIITVNRWYPSSKTCNSCGWINSELTLADREWICLDCGTVNERDFNAAQNLRDEGLRLKQSLAGSPVTGRTSTLADGPVVRQTLTNKIPVGIGLVDGSG